MSENINFIPAAELPLAEGMEVETLCIENGELKRSANGVGGGYLIKLPASAMNEGDGGVEPNEDGSLNVIIESSYDEFIGVLLAGGSVWLDFSEVFAAMGMTGVALAGSVISWGFVGDLDNMLFLRATVTMFAEGMQSLMFNVIFPNGTWRPD